MTSWPFSDIAKATGVPNFPRPTSPTLQCNFVCCPAEGLPLTTDSCSVPKAMASSFAFRPVSRDSLAPSPRVSQPDQRVSDPNQTAKQKKQSSHQSMLPVIMEDNDN